MNQSDNTDNRRHSHVPLKDNSGRADSMLMPKAINREWIEYSKLDKIEPAHYLVLDFKETKFIDSCGIALISLLQKRWAAAGHQIKVANISDQLNQMLTRWNNNPSSDAPLVEKQEQYSIRIGDSLIKFYQKALSGISLLVEMLYWASFGIAKKKDLRKGVFGEQLFSCGYGAIGIVCLLSFLIGFVLSVQSWRQLQLFSAEVYVIPMIAVSMIREIGPIITAIILAGRTGSATTAEIATMKVQEEVDALTIMGLNPIQLILVQKIWAFTIAMPLLTIFSIAAGISGGLVVTTFFAHIQFSLFAQKLVEFIFFRDVLLSTIKSIVFSWLILWVGAFYGFKVSGGAEEVGKETTRSVVTAIFIIVIVDALFSFGY